MQKGDDDLVAREDDEVGLLLPHHAPERLDDLLRVKQVIVVRVPLVAHLRPAAAPRATDLKAVHLMEHQPPAEAEDEESGRVGVGHERDVPRLLVYQPGQRVEVRKLPDVQPVPREGRVELQCL